MDRTVDPDDAGAPKGDPPAPAPGVYPQVEIVGLRERKDVVKDPVVVGKIDGLTRRDDEESGNEGRPLLANPGDPRRRA